MSAREIDRRLADRVRQLRQARGMTQASLAARIGVSGAQLGQVEQARAEGSHGRKRALSVGEAVLACRALGVPLSLLIRVDQLPTEALMGPLPEVKRW